MKHPLHEAPPARLSFLSALLGFLLTVPASTVLSDTPTLETCRLGTAYGEIYLLDTGEVVEFDEEALPGQFDEILACVRAAVGSSDIEAMKGATRALLGAAAKRDSPLAERLEAIEALAAASTSSTAVEQVHVARRLAARAGLDSAGAKTRALRLTGAAGRPTGPRHLDEPAAYSNLAEDYRQRCRDRGIPVPGAIGTAGWSSAFDVSADIANERIHVIPTYKTLTLWKFEDRGGGRCVAFLRRKLKEGGTTGDFDIAPPKLAYICENSDRDEACFFDSIAYDGTRRKRLDYEEALATGPDSLVHPLDGEDNCSTCHLGDNALIVHPRTELAKAIYSSPAGPLPLSKTKNQQFKFMRFKVPGAEWCNPRPYQPAAGRGECTSCHDIATRTGKYCALIAWSSGRTMPPSLSARPDEPLWPRADGSFSNGLATIHSLLVPSIREIYDMCRADHSGVC